MENKRTEYMLKVKQRQLIPLIIKYGNIDKACRAANIDRTTYYKWLKEEEFCKELKAQQENLYNSSIVELKNLFIRAIETYGNLLESEDENIKFKTATAIIDNTVKLIEAKEIEERIELIEKNIEGRKV
jgi:hypothetical protein